MLCLSAKIAVLTSMVFCYGNGFLLGQAFKQFEDHGCVILISEHHAPLDIFPADLKVPYIQISLGILKRKDNVFNYCGHIIMNLDAYEPKMQHEIATKLPTTHKILFLLTNANHIEEFPKLARLPLSLYFVSSNNSKLTVKSRPDITKENEIKTLEVYDNINGLKGKIKAVCKLQIDFHGGRFSAVAFPYKPYSMPNYQDPSKNSGYEYEIAKVVTESLNLKLDISPPSSGFMWGSGNMQTGNYTGLVGDLQHSVAEIGWANLFITKDRSRVMDYSDWYMVEPACFLLKKGGPYHGIYSLIFPLEAEIWFMIFIVIVAFIGYYFLFLMYSQNSSSYNYIGLLLYAFSVVFKVSHRYSHENASIEFRLANFTLILGMFILAADYSGALVSFFSVEVYPKNPETFEDLAEMVQVKDSKIRICCLTIKEAMEESNLESFKLLSQPERRLKTNHGKVQEALMGTYRYGDIYVLTRNALEIQKRVHNKFVPYDEVFIMKECFLPIQIALGLSFNSPFKMAINHRLGQLKESGIINKLINKGHTMAGSIQNHIGSNNNKFEEIIGEHGVRYRQLDLTKVQGIFELHLCLLGLAILSFTIEHWRKPNMDLIKVKVSNHFNKLYIVLFTHR